MRRTHRSTVLVTLALLGGLLVPTPAAAAPTWLAPVSLSAQGNDAVDPQVAADAAGNATAVWARSDGTNRRIQASTRLVGGGWSAPDTISLAGQDSNEPQVAVDAAGNATVVWKRTDGSTDQIRTSSRPFGGAWTVPITLSSAAQDDVGEPRVAVDGAGNATAIWSRLSGGNRRVHASTRPPGGDWSAVDIISAAGGSARDLALAANPGADGATALWTRDNGANYQVQVSSRLTTTTWSPVETLSTAGRDAVSPEVVVEASGRATAVWARSDGVAKRIQTRSRQPGGGWLEALVVNLSEAGQEADFPQVAVDPAGNTTVVWSRSDGTNGRIQASTRPVGGSWSAVPDTLSVAGQVAREPQLVVDATGTTTAVWSRSDGADYRVQSSRRPVDGAWAAPLTLSVAGQAAIEPHLAVDPAGDVTTVWSRSDAVSSRVQAIGLDVAGPVVGVVTIPATGAVSVPVAMSATASDTWSAVASTVWAFGDGSTATATGTSVSHAYAAAGSYDVSVTITDAVGNATTRTGTVAVAAAPPVTPPVTPPVAPPIGVAPSISSFTIKPARIRAVGSDSSARKRARADIVLTAAATVTITFKKKGAKKAAATLTKTLRAGTSEVTIKARVGRKVLRPGTYVVRATAGVSTKKAKLRVVR